MCYIRQFHCTRELHMYINSHPLQACWDWMYHLINIYILLPFVNIHCMCFNNWMMFMYNGQETYRTIFSVSLILLWIIRNFS